MEEEYYELVKEILDHPEFQKRKTYFHHGKRTVFDHSLSVSYYSYCFAKKLHLPYHDLAIAALLHDFYDHPWQGNSKKEPFFQQHGFVHAHQALLNSKKYFPHLTNPRIENTIERHMFPLNIRPPRYWQGWVVTIVDKYVSLEIFKEVNKLPKYLGISHKKKKGES